MAWLREIGLNFVDINVKSDNDPIRTSLIESWSTLRSMTSGSRMIIGSSKSKGIGESTIQSAQGMTRIIRSAMEEPWGVKVDVTHSVGPCIAEGLLFEEEILWKRRRAGGSLGKLTCKWEDGVCLGIKATTGKIIVVNRNGVCKNGPEEDSGRKMGTKQFGDDRGGSLAQERRRCTHGRIMYQRRGRVIMDKDYKGKLEMEEHVPEPKGVFITREDLEVFGFAARCPRCLSLLKGRRDRRTRKTAESRLRCTVKAEASQRRVKGLSGQDG